jgi:hypothetical protein
MKKNPINSGVRAENMEKIEPVTRDDVQARARELALIDGRTAPDVSQADYEQAKRELTGESDLDRQEAVLDALPEEKRGDPAPDSTGHQVPESVNEDEDDSDEEGRSESEQSAERGVEHAEHDQVLQAAIDSAKKDRKKS